MIATEVISPWTVYWITRLTGVSIFLFLLALGASTIWVMITWSTLEDCYKPEDEIRVWKKALRYLWVPLTLIAVFLAVPTTKEACAIYLIPKITNNESVQEIGVDIKTLAREWLEELRPAVKKAEPAKGE